MSSPSTFHHLDWYERVLGMSKTADREGSDLDPRVDAI